MEVTEVIIYTIKKEHRKNTEQILTALRTVVKEIKGFKDIKSFNGCNDETKLMDLVIWESLEDANNSKDIFRANQEYARISSYFDEMEYFNQFYSYL